MVWWWVLLAGCPGSSEECVVERVSFTQADGCINDGTYEFCVDPDDEAAVLAAAPTATCVLGVGGRAGCQDSLYCAVPVDVADCDGAAMTDPAWATVCRVSNLPLLSAIVPTFYE
jgi:hypothetical protein